MMKTLPMAVQISSLPTMPPDINFSIALCVLASGSKGNAVFIAGGSTAILLDAGLSGIEIERRMRSRGLAPEDLNAILVSHEHTDHVQSVGVLSRRFKLPVYLNLKTGRAAEIHIGALHKRQVFECGTSFTIGDLLLHPFSVSHDAADPAGFTITQNKVKIGIATDLGIGTAMVKQHLKNCDLLVLEANHDPTMLADGPYPWPIKQRIKSRSGHLSNQESCNLLKEVQQPRLKHVVLAHLSETNNTAQIARKAVAQALSNSLARCTSARQDISSDIILLQ